MFVHSECTELDTLAWNGVMAFSPPTTRFYCLFVSFFNQDSLSHDVGRLIQGF